MLKHFTFLTVLFLALLLSGNAVAAPQDNSSTPDVLPILSAGDNGTTNETNDKTADKKANGENSDEALFNLIAAQSGATPEGSAAEEGPQPTKDPLIGYNRFMFKVNEKLDTYAGKPIARLYNKIIPRPLNNIISRFYSNIDNVPTIGNDLLQANFYQATSDSWRLLINSTVGIGGAFDVAASTGLQPNYEDFGLTLAQWGWKNSTYFVLPVLGPSTLRDAGGRYVTYQMSIYPYISPSLLRESLYITGLVNDRAQLLQLQALFDQAAIDPYIFTRSAYLQRRAYLIKRNKELDNPYTAKEMKPFYDPFYLYH